MDCPHCRSGPLRVFSGVSVTCPQKGERPECNCDHRPIICEHCFTMFIPVCGPPFDQSKLPPEFPMQIFQLGEAAENRSAAEDELFRRRLRIYWPTLEEFLGRINKKEKSR